MKRALFSVLISLFFTAILAQGSRAEPDPTAPPLTDAPYGFKDGRIDSGIGGAAPGPLISSNQLTDDINSPGWKPAAVGVDRIYWRGTTTACEPCRGLVGDYNWVMDELMLIRFELRQAEYLEQATVERLRREVNPDGKTKVSESRAAEQLGAILSVAEKFKALKAALHRHEALVAAEAQTLRQMIADCEKQCQATTTRTSGIRLGGLPAIAGTDPKNLPDFSVDLTPPFPWNGPYPEVCFRCKLLADRLNLLPKMARYYQVAISTFKRDVEITGLQQEIGAAMHESDILPPYVGAARDGASAAAGVRDMEAYLQAVTRNFHATLALYNDCIKTCKTKTACYEPERSYQNVSIGPNETYGSGAQVKDTAASLVGGGVGLGSLGGGSSFGGGLGGKNSSSGTFSASKTKGGAGSKEPEMVDDPTTGDFTTVSAGDAIMGLRANLTDDGLLVSAKLTDVPGDGTFHAMWLEDNEGRIIRPTRYLPFSMYREWRLKVWWTYDRWVDGQHVEHKEGGWTETWREDRDGLLAFYGGEQGVKNAIWHGLGFATPVRGIQHLGALFPIAAADLAGPCPLRLVTHVALPDEDPVITQPFVNDLSLAVDTAGLNLENEPLNIRQSFTF